MTQEISSTRAIVEALTRAIVEHRLLPGAKLKWRALASDGCYVVPL